MPIAIIAKATIKKKARILSGRFLTNSVHRSDTFTSAVSFSSITTLSLVCVKQNIKRASPANAYIVIVKNHAFPDSAELILPSGENVLTSIGIPYATANPPRFAINIRTEVSVVISCVSLVSDAFKAPYGTFTNVYAIESPM